MNSENQGADTASRLARAAMRVVGGLALSLACAAAAQSVNDYQLPPARPTPTPSPRVQGPVDPEAPVLAPQPSPAPPPAETPPPRIVLPRAAPSPSPVPRAAAPAPRAMAVDRPVPSGTPSLAASEAVPTETPAPLPTIPPAAPVPLPEAETGAGEQPVWLAIGGAVLLMLVGLAAWLSRRGRRATEADPGEALAVPPAEPAPSAEPQPSAPAKLSPPRELPAARPPKPAAAPPTPLPPPPASDGPLHIALEARHLSRAMVNATLAYRLSLTNPGGETIGSLRVTGDLTTAHASVPVDQQLSFDGQTLKPLHEVAELAPGASVTLAGELRLPIAEIRAIRGGQGHVFVPLARFHVEGAGGDPSVTRVFVIGRTGGDAGAPLRPFVFEQGPGVQREISQRELQPSA